MGQRVTDSNRRFRFTNYLYISGTMMPATSSSNTARAVVETSQPAVQNLDNMAKSGAAFSNPLKMPDGSIRPTQMAERKFITNNIPMKNCCAYKPINKQVTECKCGRKRDDRDHTESVRNPLPDDGVWLAKDENCVREVPTNAFGEVEFANANIAKYVRVSDDVDMSYMTWLLKEIWKLKQPNLLISVTGGAKNITMSKRLKDAFKQGLLKTAQSTGAWIVTGGTNQGVMKYVGEAVTMLQSSTKVVAFGIAPWGPIQNKRDLINNSRRGLWPALYSSYDDGSRNVLLDTNHTHYILVDNGTIGKFATEINFRGLFEKEISNMTMGGDDNSSTQVPVVSIVVEGGPGTLDTVKAAIDNATPVVVLEGSGRVADLLAFAYNNTIEEQVEAYGADGKLLKQKEIIPIVTEETKALLRQKVADEFPNKDTDALTANIIHCVKQRHLMVIFSLQEGSLLKDIDAAILHAIMKANKGDAMNQLKLALAWNRIDIAKEEIFIEGQTMNTEGLENILKTAIDQDKHKFVELLMENIHLGEYLTKKRLMELYNYSIPSTNLLYNLLHHNKGKKYIDLKEVGTLMQNLVGDFYLPLYLRDEIYSTVKSENFLDRQPNSEPSGKRKRHDSESEDESPDNQDTATKAQGVGTAIRTAAAFGDVAKNKSQVAPIQTVKAEKKKYDFLSPARELFIWSVLMQRKKLALLFFKEQKHTILPALLAAHIFRRLANEISDSERVRLLEASAVEFEDIAVGILSTCCLQDEAKAMALLTCIHPRMGGTTPLQMAFEAENKKFIGHQCCQKLLSNIWYGRLDENQKALYFRLIPSAFLPPLGIWLVKFKPATLEPVKTISRKNQLTIKKVKTKIEAVDTLMEGARKENPGSPQRKYDDDADDDDDDYVEDMESQELPKQNCCTTGLITLKDFYNAPLTTFITNCAFYLSFVMLFCYMMLCNFYPREPQFGWIEIVIIVWVATITLEEFRQLLDGDTNNFRQKVSNYFKDLWNILDVMTIVLFITGLGMRVSFLTYEKSLDGFTIDERDDRMTTFETWTRILFCCSLMTFIFRILHIFSVARILGPKLVMIGKMMQDLASFIIILFIFILAFGVAQQSILYPNAEFTVWTVRDSFRMAYWQMYGELFLEQLEGDIDCNTDYKCTSVLEFLLANGFEGACQNGSALIGDSCPDGSVFGCYGFNTTQVAATYPPEAFPTPETICYNNTVADLFPICDTSLPRCAALTEFVPIILAAYILLTQILMFNLLIAMFSYTFEKVQGNTDLHWMYQRYTLIQEYYLRPPTPPPFIIINHIALLIRYIYRIIKQDCLHRDVYVKDNFKVAHSDHEGRQLATWEKICFDDYYRQWKHDTNCTMQAQVAKSKAHLDTIVSNINGMSNLPLMAERLELVERRLNETGMALNWIMDNMSGNKSGKKPPMLALEGTESQKSYIDTKETEKFDLIKEQKKIVHIICRGSPYPMSSRIKRFPVKTTKVYFEIEWKMYDPAAYTAESVKLAQGDWADIDVTELTADDMRSKIKFNEKDGSVNRKSKCGVYQIDSKNRPVNPMGRTGLTGRGLLGRWGPNHAVDIILTRWKGDTKKGKPVMEFICVKRRDVAEWALPGVSKVRHISASKHKHITPDDENSLTIGKEALLEKVFNNSSGDEFLQKIDALFTHAQKIYEGYSDDPRNTDNAWIETTAYLVHDDEKISHDFILMAGPRVERVGWVEASRGLQLFAGHNQLLEIVSKKLECYY